MTASCPACLGTETHTVLSLPNMPVHVGSLWPTAEEARACHKGDMVLTHCRGCHYIFNAAFDPRVLEYTLDYDNSLESSAVFRDYLRDLAEGLVREHALNQKTIVEIGCGKGAFVSLLCDVGDNRGYGFDTTFDESTPPSERVEFIKAHYTEDQTSRPADLVCSRHVFEHIPEPLAFLQMVRRSLGDRHDTVVYFEVPESLFIFKDQSIWDLLYEHCGYFGHESLSSIFTRCGFDVQGLKTTYGGQFLGIVATPSKTDQGSAPAVGESFAIGRHVERFAEQFEARRQEWVSRIEALRAAGKRVAVWGAGGKTVTFMNLFQIAEAIETVVDINPRKQGHFVPGTGQPILAPEALRQRPPDTVIVMNKNYTSEIGKSLEELGLQPELIEAQ